MNREFVRLMQEASWTPTDCVQKLGLSKGVISQYRSGSTRPSLQVLRLFSLITGIHLQIPGETTPALHQSQVHLLPGEEKFILALRTIPPQIRWNVIDAITSLVIAATGSAVELTPEEKADPQIKSGEADRILEKIVRKGVKDSLEGKHPTPIDQDTVQSLRAAAQHTASPPVKGGPSSLQSRRPKARRT